MFLHPVDYLPSGHGWNHHHAIVISDDEIAGAHGDTAALDGAIGLKGVYLARSAHRSSVAREYGNAVIFGHDIQVSDSGVGNHSGGSAHLKLQKLHVASDGCVLLAHSIADQDVPRLAGTHRHVLRRVGSLMHLGHDVGTRRDEPQSPGPARNGLARSERLDLAHEAGVISQPTNSTIHGRNRYFFVSIDDFLSNLCHVVPS